MVILLNKGITGVRKLERGERRTEKTGPDPPRTFTTTMMMMMMMLMGKRRSNGYRM